MPDINLPNHFELMAKSMLIELEKGRAAHKASNIKASGSPLEEAFRSLLSNSLPPNNMVASGYFYGAGSCCSPEVDVLIYDSEEAFRFDIAHSEQVYVPNTSVSMIGEIKNSADQLAKAIAQVQESYKSWHEMRLEQNKINLIGGPWQEAPMTFIVCGECSDRAYTDLGKTLLAAGPPAVDYILLLDRGCIITGDLAGLDAPVIDFLQYRQATSLHVCKPDGAPGYEKGIALLWFYFAVVAKLNWDKGNNRRYHAFCRQIASLYPLRKIARLATDQR